MVFGRSACLAFFMLMSAAFLPNPAPAGQLEFYQNVINDDLSYEISIIAPSQAADSIQNTKIIIKCFEGSIDKSDYIEDTPGGFINLYRIDGLNKKIFTTWGTGVAYLVVVYGIKNGKIDKLFEAGSRWVPLWTYDGPTGDSIILSEAEWVDGERRFNQRKYNWSEGDGTYFLEAGKPGKGQNPRL